MRLGAARIRVPCVLEEEVEEERVCVEHSGESVADCECVRGLSCGARPCCPGCVFCANHDLQRGARDDDVDGIVDKLAVVVVARSVATMNHAATPLSTAESIFILRAVEEGLRVDGRKRLEQRPVAIAFGAESSASGSVQVRMGTTKVLAVATAELVAPYADRPTEGVLQFFVELSPMASPAFEPRPAARSWRLS